MESLGSHICTMLTLVFSIIVVSLAGSSLGFKLTILHTNDVHARFEEANAFGSSCTPKDKANGGCYGGVARRKTIVDQLKAKHENVLFLDAGDQFQGTLWFYMHKGKATSYFMNKLGYDAMSFGNHEFDNDIPGLVPFLENVTFPVLGCNVDASNEPTMQGKYQSSFVKTFPEGQKVGIIGYVTQDAPILAYTGKLIVKDEVSSIREEAAKLKADGASILIALGHAGFTLDKKIAQEVEDIDLVIGGHTNTFLYTGDQPSTEKIIGDYPTVVKNNGKDILVVQDYAFGKYLGFLQIDFNENGQAVSWEGNPILLNETIPQDEEFLADMEIWKEPVAELYDKVVGRSHVLLDGSRGSCRLGECNIGNMLTDAAVQRHLHHPDELYWANVTIAIMNGGSIRDSIQAGDVTVGEIMNVQPFRNTNDLVEIKGKVIRQMLEHSVSGYDEIEQDGKFLQMSGLRVKYDLSKPDGSRVVEVFAKCSECMIPKFEPLKDEDTYKMIVPLYLVSGGDGYSMIKEHMTKHHIFGDIDSEVTIEYITQTSPIITGLEDRIEFVKEDVDNCPVSSGITLGGSVVLYMLTFIGAFIYYV